MTEIVNRYTDGYDKAMTQTFHPEMGWFWSVLEEARMHMVAEYPECKAGVHAMSDELVELIMQRVSP